MTNRQRDAEVAEKVFGWRLMLFRHDPGRTKAYIREFSQLISPETFATFERREHYTLTAMDWSELTDSERKDEIENAPHYTTDPADDYKVLEKVRGEWTLPMQKAVADALHDNCQARWQASGKRTDPWLLYQPGDYSKAALAVLDAGQGKGE